MARRRAHGRVAWSTLSSGMPCRPSASIDGETAGAGGRAAGRARAGFSRRAAGPGVTAPERSGRWCPALRRHRCQAHRPGTSEGEAPSAGASAGTAAATPWPSASGTWGLRDTNRAPQRWGARPAGSRAALGCPRQRTAAVGSALGAVPTRDAVSAGCGRTASVAPAGPRPDGGRVSGRGSKVVRPAQCAGLPEAEDGRGSSGAASARSEGRHVGARPPGPRAARVCRRQRTAAVGSALGAGPPPETQ
jgi:hypothetical protein